VTGTLGLFSLVDLFQLLTASARTGRLVIDHPQGIARVYFDKGKIVHAEFGGLTAEEAVYALFADERGAFEFTLGLPAPQVTIQVGTENLLLEAIRRVDEARRDAPEATTTLADDVVPAFNEQSFTAGRVTFRAEEVALLRLIDGRKDLRQIADSAGVPLTEARHIIARLLQIGALTIANRKPRVARLVARLAPQPLPPGAAGIDSNIVASWARVLGYVPRRVACKRPSGKVEGFELVSVEEAGPFILFSRDTLFAHDLAVDTALLVKPALEGTLGR
jgi:hypothetical protein